MSEKKTFGVVFGGVSSEHSVSCVSAAWVADSIDKDKYDVVKIGITENGVWFLYEGDTENIKNNTWEQDTANLYPCVVSPCTVQHGIFVFNKKEGTFMSKRLDAVFPVLHGKNGEDGTIQGLFTLAGIPFVGPNTYSSAVCMNKHATKLIVKADGCIALADWICVKNSESGKAQAKSWAKTKYYPLFVKPACAGSSVGVTKVRSDSELACAIELAGAHDTDILVEEAIVGKEIEVAVLSCPEGDIVSRCGEIESGADFYDYEAKYVNDSSKHYIPARIDTQMAEKVRAAALRIFKLLNCNGLSRVDFFVTNNGEIIFNEINTIPGMTPISLYPLLMKDSGIDRQKLMDKLFSSAIGECNE